MPEKEYSFKATFNQLSDHNGPILTNEPRGKDVIFVQYKYKWKLPISPDEAYELAMNGIYWFKEGWGETRLVGGPYQFLQMISEQTGWEHSWPDPYSNHPIFNRWEQYQCEPVRELLRRHLDPKARLYDKDLVITVRE